MKGTELLELEHRTIERVTLACGMFAEALQNGTKVPVGVLENLVQFLHVFCADYHHQQEAWFFALLQVKGFPSEDFPIDSLRREHAKLASLTDQLRNSVDVYAMSDGSIDGTVISALLALAELYSDHVWKENYVLLPIAEELFSAADQRVLADTLHTIETAKGADAQRAVQQLGASIRQCL